jgi:hypothetical protein
MLAIPSLHDKKGLIQPMFPGRRLPGIKLAEASIQAQGISSGEMPRASHRGCAGLRLSGTFSHDWCSGNLPPCAKDLA